MSDYPRCKTCKWWDPDYKIPYMYAYRQDEGWGACSLTASYGNERPSETFTLAYAVNDDEYQAVLVAHEDFGCVQHELEAGK